MTLRLIDTFSGIGGFSYAAEQLVGGFTTVQFVEREPFCQRILSKHWPTVPIHDDICTFNPAPGSADVICGGFPCQDISQAGKGAGLAGSRSGLFYELLRVVRLVGPRYVVLENVAAITHRGMDAVLGALAEAGYNCEWACIPAAAMGACHQRDRWWCVAYAKDMLGHGGTGQQQGQPRGQAAPESGDGDRAATPDPMRHRLEGPHELGSSGVPWPSAIARLSSDWRSYLSEPVLCRGDDGLSAKLDKVGRLINEANDPQSIAAACEFGEQVLQDMWQRQSTTAAPQHLFAIRHPDSVSAVPCGVAHCRGDVGQRGQGSEQVSKGLRDLWHSLSGEAFQTGQDMFSSLSQRARQVERWQTSALSGRVDRLKALGNAVVPQVAAIPLARVLDLERRSG